MLGMGNLLVKNGKVMINGVAVNLDLLIENGLISKIACCMEPNGTEVLDADGMYVLPGLIDEHVHLRDPGLTYKEDFSTGTSAAAAGGITLVFDMPNTLPPVDSESSFMEKKEIAMNKSRVDFGLYGLIRDTTSVQGLRKLVNAGAIGFKSYMGPTTGNIPPPSHSTLYTAMKELSAAGVPIVVHAEDEELVKHFSGEAGNDELWHLRSRPYVCETFSTGELLALAEHTGARVHIAHISSLRTLKIIQFARINGIGLTGEATPHHLFLDSEIYSRAGNLAKINPPIRDREDSDALMKAIKDGTILTVGSDHSPHSVEEKLGNNPPSGFPGLETEVPLLLNAVKARKLELADIVRLMSENVARLFGIYPGHGAIVPRSRGNLTIVSLKHQTKIDAAKFYSKAKYSPFDGAVLDGRVMYTVVGGEIAYDGEVHDVKGEFVSNSLKNLSIL